MNQKKNVTIYTDGACSPNPGPGGYGVVLLYGEHRHEISEGFRQTTNNRMELLAPIKGLEALNQSCRVTLHSDSRYVVDGIEKGWAKRWRKKGWMRTKKNRAINPDLWARLLDLCEQHEVEFKWVRGHSGDPENERCDHLATEASRGPNLSVDDGYETPKSDPFNTRDSGP
ncbi:MAG: ribonuclease HI [Chloroflexi bacterium]|nr:ribonuclease HI [Chloroflexota bacterium]MYK61789.1 ribonuclease HI [Chloroflexota bacterium]